VTTEKNVEAPVATIGELNGTKLIVGHDDGLLASLPKGTKIYARPDPDVAALIIDANRLEQKVIALELREARVRALADAWAIHPRINSEFFASELRAALEGFNRGD
jgi:hypothetical protein